MTLSWKQVLASVSGAVLAALALSFLGAAGTIVGVALGSAAATIGSAAVFKSLDEGHRKVQELITKAPDTTRYVPPPTGYSSDAPTASGVLSRDVSPDVIQPAAPLPPPLTGPRPKVGRHWSILAAVALVFGISLGVVTVIEIVAGESFSTAVGQHGSNAVTSVGGLFRSAPTTTTTSSTTTSTSTTTTTTTPSSTTSSSTTSTTSTSTTTTSTP